MYYAKVTASLREIAHHCVWLLESESNRQPPESKSGALNPFALSSSTRVFPRRHRCCELPNMIMSPRLSPARDGQFFHGGFPPGHIHSNTSCVPFGFGTGFGRTPPLQRLSRTAMATETGQPAPPLRGDWEPGIPARVNRAGFG